MDISKEFCEEAAKDEDGLDVSAGTLANDPLSIAHGDLILASIRASNIHEELVAAYWLEAAVASEIFIEGRIENAQKDFKKLADSFGYDLVKRSPVETDGESA